MKMANERGERIYRKATDEERKRHTTVREQTPMFYDDVQPRWGWVNIIYLLR